MPVVLSWIFLLSSFFSSYCYECVLGYRSLVQSYMAWGRRKVGLEFGTDSGQASVSFCGFCLDFSFHHLLWVILNLFMVACRHTYPCQLSALG